MVILILSTWSVIEVRRNMRQYLTAHLEREGLAIARDFSDFTRAPSLIFTNNLYMLQRLINNTVANNEDVRYILVLDGNGESVVHTFAAGIPQGLLKINNNVGNKSYNIQRIRTEEGMIIDIAVPMTLRGIGLVRVGMTEKNINAFLAKTTVKLLGDSLVVLAISLLAVYFITRLVTRPILELSKAAQAMAQGNFNQAMVAIDSGTGEVDQLSGAFNTMVEKIQASKKETELLEEKRKQLLAKILTVQEEERKRIARELHDETGQSLTAMSLELSLIDSAGTAQEIKQRTDNLRDFINTVMKSLRELIWELRPVSLDDLGLEAAIKRHIVDHLVKLGRHADLQVHNIAELKLPSAVATTIYRIVQEAVTNIIKHGNARNISVVLERSGENFLVIIEDDGVGFDVDEVMKSALAQEKFGLFGMEERAVLIGGQLTIESEPYVGTTIYLKIPIGEAGEFGENQSTAG